MKACLILIKISNPEIVKGDPSGPFLVKLFLAISIKIKEELVHIDNSEIPNDELGTRAALELLPSIIKLAINDACKDSGRDPTKLFEDLMYNMKIFK